MFLCFNRAVQEDVSCIWEGQVARHKGSISAFEKTAVFEQCCLFMRSQILLLTWKLKYLTDLIGILFGLEQDLTLEIR